MTREEAIARIKDHKIIHKMDEPRAIYISEALDMAIEALEQTRWIPVSEELPEKNEWYSCTVNLSDFHYVTMDLYFKDGKWLDNRRINMFHCYEVYGFGKSTEKHKLDYSELLEDFDWTERVIAWMPLLEPYGG